jgi:hypothetical protein
MNARWTLLIALAAPSVALAEPARTPEVIFDALDQNSAQLVDTSVTVDGTLVSESIDGHAVPLEPGHHKAHFESTGHTPTDVEFDVHEGDPRKIIHAKLTALGESGTPVEPEKPLGRPFGIAPWLTVGFGAAVLGTGIGLLVVGLGEISDAESRCPNRVCPLQADTDLGQEGIAMASAGRVLVPVGAVVMLGSLVLQLVFNTEPKAPRAAFILRGTF